MAISWTLKAIKKLWLSLSENKDAPFFEVNSCSKMWQKSYRVRACDDFKPPKIQLVHSTVQPENAFEDSAFKLRFETVKF